MICLYFFLKRLGIRSLTPMPIHYDSQAVLFIAKNRGFYDLKKRTKMDCHFICDKDIEVSYF